MRFFIIFILSGLTGAFFAIMDWPIEMMFIVLAVIAITSMGYIFYINYFSKSFTAIEKYLAKNHKNPIYHYTYILPTATDEQLIQALQAIIQKYAHTKYKSIYNTYLALMEEDIVSAHQHVVPIQHTEIGRYTSALINVYEGNYDEALQHQVQKKWMKHSILTHIAFFKKDLNAFKEEAALAVSSTGGVQRYSNYYTFERMKKELQKNQP